MLLQNSTSGSLILNDSSAGLLPDSLILSDSLPPADSVTVPDSVMLSDSTGTDSVFTDSSEADSVSTGDSAAVDSVVAYTARELKRMAKDSARARKDAYLDSVSAVKQAAKDSIHHIRDSVKSVRDSIRWSKPRVIETGFLPDSMYYKRIISWTADPYVNDYQPAGMDTTFNDWYTEYPFYKEDIDAVYLGTIGSAAQNVNFFKRREFNIFKAYAPYLTYSHTPEDMPFFNTKAPYTELAYWGTLFAYKDKEETNVRFMHTQNITPAWNISVLFQGWKAAGMLEHEATANNSLEVGTNYLGKRYVMNAGFIHHNIDRQENGGIQDPFMVRDTVVDAKTIAVNLQDAHNKLSRNTFFIDHSYNIHLDSKQTRLRRAMEADSALTASVDSIMKVRMQAYEAAVNAAMEAARRPPVDSTALTDSLKSLPADSLAGSLTAVVTDSTELRISETPTVTDSLSQTISDTLAVPSADSTTQALPLPDPVSAPPVDTLQMRLDSIAKAQADSILRASITDTLLPPTEDEIYALLADSLLFGSQGDGPMITVGHIGEVSRFYRYYTDNISQSDDAGRAFYNDMFYIHPQASADSSRVFTVENRLFFKLQPWARDAIVSEISGGIGHQFNSIYAFRPDMFLTGNSNVNQNNLYVYAGTGGQYRKYLDWGANAKYTFLGYNINDFAVDAHVGFSFYPFKDKSEPITLSGRFSTSLEEPDWYSQHYWSNHYVWDNDFGKTSTTKVEASLSIPKWRMEAYFGYALVNNYLYHDTLGISRQHTGLLNIMSAYVRKDFKLWWFHLDNQVLFQYSSNKDVLPLPMLTFHLRYYLEIEAVKNVLKVQLGADARLNTLYYAPAYNPALGAFQLQTEELLGNNPYIDVFLNLQWKRVNVFLKVVNVGQYWPDGGMMFSAYHYIKPTMGFKVGIHWPFYIE